MPNMGMRDEMRNSGGLIAPLNDFAWGSLCGDYVFQCLLELRSC
jgi:hypothetical protein